MARLMVLTDRTPDDADWKGAFTWRIIQSLAESHHEVLAVTPLPVEKITVHHPRLTVTQPIQSWRADQLPRLTLLLMKFRPQVIHTFALKSTALWPSLTLWPYLNGVCSMLPGVRRFSTLFEPADDSLWHQGSHHVTAFCELPRAEVLPLDLEFTGVPASQAEGTLIPAPVDEWEDPEQGLRHLAEYLNRNPRQTVRIIGGWGNWKPAERKNVWRRLGPAAARVALCAGLSLQEFLSELRATERLWLEPLRRDSWKLQLSTRLATIWNKECLTSSPLTMKHIGGSTANHLSRLYSRA